MSLNRLFSVSSAVNYVAPRYVSMMCSLLVSSGLMMLGRFPVMACSMRQETPTHCKISTARKIKTEAPPALSPKRRMRGSSV